MSYFYQEAYDNLREDILFSIHNHIKYLTTDENLGYINVIPERYLYGGTIIAVSKDLVVVENEESPEDSEYPIGDMGIEYLIYLEETLDNICYDVGEERRKAAA